MSHTPGPWHQGTNPKQIEAIDGAIVALVSGAIWHPYVLPDARLIAAAPEMFEALCFAIEALKRQAPLNPLSKDALQRAIEVTSKALGDQS